MAEHDTALCAEEALEWTYFGPGGLRREGCLLTSIRIDDANWLREKEAKISGETLSTGEFAFYADVGIRDGGTPVEAIIIASSSDDPFEKFAELRQQAQALLEQHNAS